MKLLPTIRTCDELCSLVEEVGFLPFFSNEMPGFSVMDITRSSPWWSSDEKRDPWQWRIQIAKGGKIAYGKFFKNKAGFISNEWLPVFANYRRDGYDFDTLFELGRAPRRAKLIMDLFESRAALPSFEIRRLAGFGKDGEKGFSGVITSLQMQMYITTSGFERKKNKQGAEYGWPVSIFSTVEEIFGYDYAKSKYTDDPAKSLDSIFEQSKKYIDGAYDDEILKFIK